jgi:hypothetical protein
VTGGILDGFDPVSYWSIAINEGRGPDPVGPPVGLDEKVGGFIDHFRRDPQARLWMQAARRAGCTYTEAADRWSDPDDVAAEVAWDAYLADEARQMCGTCGVKHDDVLGANGRPLRFGKWKIVERGCWWCGEIHKAREAIKDRTAQGAHITIEPRRVGDPMIDLAR